MNKSKCCNAELIGAVARGWCSDKNKHKEMDTDLAEAIVMEVQKLKPKTTKYYQVTYCKGENTKYLNDIVIADNPVRAMEIVTSGIGCKFHGIKLIEIIQEDTTNQESNEAK